MADVIESNNNSDIIKKPISKDIKEDIKEEDKFFVSVFDSGHDFFDDRVGKTKRGEEKESFETKLKKRAFAATLMYDALYDSKIFTPFPETARESKKQIDKTKALVKEKAGITIFKEDPIIQAMEMKYDVVLGTNYSTLDYADLLTCDDPEPSKACKHVLESNIAKLPGNEIKAEKNPINLMKIKSFIQKFFGIDQLTIASDGTPQSVFSNFKDNDIGVKYLMNWANKFDPAGGMNADRETITPSPEIQNLAKLPGSELTYWIGKKINKLDELKMSINTAFPNAWTQDRNDIVSLNIGTNEWYKLDPSLKSPGVTALSATFILNETENDKVPGPENKTESMKVLRKKLAELLGSILPGDTNKVLRQRLYIAYFMDLKEAGDRSQIQWVDDFSTSERPITFLTLDRICSLTARMYTTINVIYANKDKVNLFKAYRPKTNVPVDPLFRIYSSIVEKINQINYIYAFSSQFAKADYFEQVKDYLQSGSTFPSANYSDKDIPALLPSLFVSLHAAERVKDINTFISQIQTYSKVFQINQDALEPAIRERINTFRNEASQLKYTLIKLYEELAPEEKTQERVETLYSALKRLVSDDTFSKFEESSKYFLGLQLKYVGDTIDFENLHSPDNPKFWTLNADLSKLQFNTSENKFYKFIEGNEISQGMIPLEVSEIQNELNDLSQLGGGRQLTSKLHSFASLLENYKYFFDTSTKYYDDYMTLIDTFRRTIDLGDNYTMNLSVVVNGLINIKNRYWAEVINPVKVGGAYYNSPNSQNTYGSTQSPLLSVQRVSLDSLFENASIIRSAFNAFEKALHARSELETLLGDSLEKTDAYNSLRILGGTRKHRRKQHRKTYKRKQKGGIPSEEETQTQKSFTQATQRYMSSLRSIAYDFNTQFRTLDIVNDKISYMESVVDNIVELNNEYINDISIPLNIFISIVPLPSSKSFNDINSLICAVTNALFSLDRCPPMIGQRAILTDRFFNAGTNAFNEQYIQFVLNITFAFGLNISEADIRADTTKALLQCVRSIQFMAESYLNSLPPATPDTTDTDAFYGEDIDITQPSKVGNKRNRTRNNLNNNNNNNSVIQPSTKRIKTRKLRRN
jgi:hypothetical protein